MRRIATLTRNPAVIALVMALAVTGCASKKIPNNAADIGLGGAGSATPGSQQDFTVNGLIPAQTATIDAADNIDGDTGVDLSDTVTVTVTF